MPSLALHAARPTLALIAAVAAITGSPLAAQSDPFALPEGLTAQSVRPDEGSRLAEITVDGRSRARMVTVAGSGREMTIDADDARAAGLPVADGARGAVKLASLELYEWKFDSLRQRVAVKLFRKGDGENLKDFAARPEAASESSSLLALRVDYDLSATVTITIKCTPNTNFTIDIDKGLNPQGANRRMRSVVTNGYITYDVYRDSPRSNTWGTGQLKNVAGNSGTGAPLDILVYGRVPKNQVIGSGDYKDTLAVTLNF